MSKGTEIKFELSDADREQLEQEAKKRGISPDECASQLIKEWLHGTLGDLARPTKED